MHWFITLFSAMNPNMTIAIEPFTFVKWEDIEKIAGKAYKDWFDNEKEDIGNTTLPEYIENHLEKEGFILGEHYKMYLDTRWDRTEILIQLDK